MGAISIVGRVGPRASWLRSVVAWLIVSAALSPGLWADEIQFNRHIRPILAENCLHCHGFDEQTRQAELRLDTFEGATSDRQGTVAIQPGHLESSQLWSRINETDPDLVMPPPSTKKRLTAPEKDLLGRWIKAGAAFQTHWSFAPLQSAPAPHANLPKGLLTAVDSFIAAGLEREGLELAAPADKATLLRRAALDLTGLPPSVEDLDAFLLDDEPNAFEKQVDRLLSSPQYGEHLAAWWSDLARYADSNGFQNDFLRQQWPWRDWVINAFNRNMPFDQFTIEQLAGDLLPNATRDQQIATGFNRNNRTVTEAGSVPEEWRAEYVIDRAETTAAVWMGLTLGCCRCHDHKYDPFTQKDFYRLAAYFNNVAEEGLIREAPGNAPPNHPSAAAAGGA